MTSSETSTESAAPTADSTFQAWHFYMLIAMVGATAAVVLAPNTHPAALLLLSAAVVSAGLVGYAVHRALQGFLEEGYEEVATLDMRTRQTLEHDKALALRAIKELEFDHRMGKIDDAEFRAMEQRLRGRALDLMAELERQPTVAPAAPLEHRPPATPACSECGTANDMDARFCKSCGHRL